MTSREACRPGTPLSYSATLGGILWVIVPPWVIPGNTLGQQDDLFSKYTSGVGGGGRGGELVTCSRRRSRSGGWNGRMQLIQAIVGSGDAGIIAAPFEIHL